MSCLYSAVTVSSFNRASTSDVVAAISMQGLHYNRQRGHFGARHSLHVVTQSQPLNRVSFQMSMWSKSFTSHVPAAQKANEAIRFLTDGHVLARHTAQGVADTDWQRANLMPIVRSFKYRVLDYNAE